MLPFLNDWHFKSASKENRLNDSKNEVLKAFEDYVRTIPAEWNGIECISEMSESGYSQSMQAEWAGSYNEFRLRKYLDEHPEASRHIEFYQDRSRGGIDLDLRLPSINSYADVKIHSSASGAVIGNDCRTVDRILDENPDAKIYLLVTDIQARRDRDFDYETTVFWNNLLHKENRYSYGRRMKHSAAVDKVSLLEINSANRDRLSLFRQGRNSNGKPRFPKYKINRKDIEAFAVKEWKIPPQTADGREGCQNSSS